MNASRNTTLRNTLPAICSAIAGQKGVKIVWQGPPRTEGTTIWSSPLPVDADESTVKMVVGDIDHECGHIRHSDFDMVGKKRPTISDLQFGIWNALEDTFIERKLGDDYLGCQQTLAESAEIAVARGQCRTGEKGPADALQVFCDAWGRKNVLLQGVDPILATSRAELVKHIEEKGVARLEALLSTKLYSANSTAETLKLSGQVVQLIKDIQDEQEKPPEPKPQEKKPSDPQEGKGGSGQGSSGGQDGTDQGSDGDQDEPGQGSDGDQEKSDQDSNGGQGDSGQGSDGDQDEPDQGSDGDQEESDQGSSGGQDGTDQGSDGDQEKSDQDSNGGQGDSGQGSDGDQDEPGQGSDGDQEESDQGSSGGQDGTGQDSDGDQDGSDQKADDSSQGGGAGRGGSARQILEDANIDQGPAIDRKGAAQAMAAEAAAKGNFVFNPQTITPPPQGENLPRYSALKGAVSGQISQLQRRLVVEFQTKRRSRTVVAEEGRLDGRRLHQALVGETRVYRHKVVTQAPKPAVSLVLDCSGSMGWAIKGSGLVLKDDIILATQAVIAMAEVCAVMGVPFEVIPFAGSQIGAIKTFDAPLARARGRIGAIAASGGTPTAEALWIAGNRLVARREERKILMLVTDGSPDNMPAAQQVAGLIERSGIELYGVGIGTEAVRKICRKSGVIKSANDLAPAILNALAERMLAAA
ncbi:MAG: VWA domain-containing protein [Gammaproteobacteria bacterium]|nr:VWA domain-containing protein [Gammaproteobacteria bacterium]MBU1655172.1 VWA domain-containing protein [Gammaproteobacteria bacterium]